MTLGVELLHRPRACCARTRAACGWAAPTPVARAISSATRCCSSRRGCRTTSSPRAWPGREARCGRSATRTARGRSRPPSGTGAATRRSWTPSRPTRTRRRSCARWPSCRDRCAIAGRRARLRDHVDGARDQRHVEDAANRRRDVDQLEPAAACGQPLRRRQQHAERGRVEEADAGSVDANDVALALGRVECGAQRIGGPDVELARPPAAPEPPRPRGGVGSAGRDCAGVAGSCMVKTYRVRAVGKRVVSPDRSRRSSRPRCRAAVSGRISPSGERGDDRQSQPQPGAVDARRKAAAEVAHGNLEDRVHALGGELDVPSTVAGSAGTRAGRRWCRPR